MTYIDQKTPLTALQSYLDTLGLLDNEKLLRVETPGEGNMNVVLRVVSDKRSFILKQSRPFVQKYPSIPAPLDRIGTEYQFYHSLAEAGSNLGMPKILAYSESEHLLMMEDLGNCEDMTSVYTKRSIDQGNLKELLSIASRVHQTTTSQTYPLNTDLRLLNHQHIFVLPFQLDNGFELNTIQDGLQELSMEYKKDELLKKEITAMGSLYLSTGDTLIHGDYYPGSWMRSEDDLYVIDPEFSFNGFKEFDLGVMAAHLVISTMDIGVINKVIQLYNSPLEKKIVYKITGIEILRRLIGLAQLPLVRTMEEKKELLHQAKSLVYT